MNLVSKLQKGIYVFVGDTHGDSSATKKILRTYLKPNHTICFLGDYIDRGPDSRGNLELLLKTKKQHPRKIYLLQGNHETQQSLLISDFYMSLNLSEQRKYSEFFDQFPLAFSVGQIIALHGALPDIEKLDDIKRIERGSESWKRITWGDFDLTHHNAEWPAGTRPTFGKNYFKRIMSNLDKKILIRGHDPNFPEQAYDDRCLTIFTSSAYHRRQIAIADFDKHPEINRISDLSIIDI